MEASEHSEALEYTPTWVLAAVCTVIVFISLLAERGLHFLGKILKHNQQNALYEALQKLKEELMLLGFISLLLTVFQRTINHICVPKSYFFHMLPCNEKSFSHNGKVHHDKGVNHQITQKHRKLLSENEDTDICLSKGKIPLLSIEALEQLHIFIFVLAVVHVVFCATTMILGGAKIRKWKHWENDIRKQQLKKENLSIDEHDTHASHHHEFVMKRAIGLWQKSIIVSWTFHASVTKSDYRALRSGFIMRHCSTNQKFDFHKYMLRTLEDDFKMVVGISWYLWLFVVIFLLLNVNGWHTFFWLSFLPLVLLLAVGTKLEQIITCLAQEAAKKPADGHEAPQVKPSDRHFWFGRPGIVLHLIHFILFQNAFGLAIFFWILCTYGFKSCIMERTGYVVPRLVIGVVIQVLCSYSTLPLYVIVTQMGDMFKQAIFDQQMQTTLHNWAENVRKRKRGKNVGVSSLMNVFTSKRKKDDEADSSQVADKITRCR
ncbi:MLO-like protein 13 isoform X2 [Zingiber officinale]|uniref:MLO-like protein 13 isoform X2 n=1 Tax=Zingiber officinale TaxID=94328 RepID=UPI001C4C0832|nr:MLO-like protein 13 isoform X2 [Zingiber officinale]